MYRNVEATDKTRHGPNRSQNVLITSCKHLHLLKNDRLRYQRKPLDPRTSGNKRLLHMLMAIDRDTRVYYGEVHTQETFKDIAGFLTRAWSRKYLHPMWGVPHEVNLPRLAYEDKDIHSDIFDMAEYCQFYQGRLPGGFNAGIHSLRIFEDRLLSAGWDRDGEPREITLDMAQALSGVCTAQSGSIWSAAWDDPELCIRPLPQIWLDHIDELYKPAGGWREGNWDLVLNGPRQETPRI